jgi:phosphate transport system substrate-binding protein
MKPRSGVVRVIFVLLAGLLTACQGVGAAPASPTGTPLSGRITFAGSTTVQPLAGKLGDVFCERHPGIQLEIAAGGTEVGIQAIHEGTADIGMASRALKPEEVKGLNPFQIAIDVLAVIVHPSNPVDGLSLAQLQNIYTGKITNWREVGGLDQPIMVLVREKSSGTRGAFDELVLAKQEPTAPALKAVVTAGDMAAAVASDPAAIGYVGFGNLEPTVKPVIIDKINPTKQTARDGSYKLVRPLLLLTGPLTQPIAQVFIDFVLSPTGQQLVEQDGWVPVR